MPIARTSTTNIYSYSYSYSYTYTYTYYLSCRIMLRQGSPLRCVRLPAAVYVDERIFVVVVHRFRYKYKYICTCMRAVYCMSM